MSLFPNGVEASGWKSLVDALSWLLGIFPRTVTAEIRRRQAVDKIVAQPISHEIVAELRNELVVLSSGIDKEDWEKISDKLKGCRIWIIAQGSLYSLPGELC